MFQQDAHEFLNYLLNTCADILKADMKEEKMLVANKRDIFDSYTIGSGHVITNGSSTTSRPNKQHTANGYFNTMPANTTNTTNATSNSSNKNKIKPNQDDENHAQTQNGPLVTDTNSNGATFSTSNPNRSSNRSINSNHSNVNNSNNETNNSNSNLNNEETWIHELFQGILVNETKCLNCESVSVELRCLSPFFFYLESEILIVNDSLYFCCLV